MAGLVSGTDRGWPFDDLPRRNFGAIAVDPPWRFASNSDTKPGRSARSHYDTLSLADIAALPVGELALPDAWCFLWIPAPFIAIGAHLPILKGWGFRISTLGLTWIKRTASGALFTGLGYTTRGNPEFVIVSRRGSPARVSRSVHSVIDAPRREHSRKPAEFHERVEALVGGVPKVELFARERRPGWSSWGDETERFAEAAE